MSSADALLELIEGYYGSYRDVPVQRAAIREWLVETNLPAALREQFYKHLIRAISTEYKNRPDIVQLEKALGDYLEIRRLEGPRQLDTGPVVSKEQAAANMTKVSDYLKRLARSKNVKHTEGKGRRREMLDRQAEQLRQQESDG